MKPKSKSKSKSGKGGNRQKSKSSDPNNSNNQRSNNKNTLYPEYTHLNECLKRYVANDTKIVRGTIRTVPGGRRAFISCDKGSHGRDILLDGEIARNRALDGDLVFIEVIGPVGEDRRNGNNKNCSVDDNGVDRMTVNNFMKELTLEDGLTTDVSDSGNKEGATSKDDNGGIEYEDYDVDSEENDDEGDDNDDENHEGETWQEDEMQRDLWDPIVNIRKRRNNTNGDANNLQHDEEQFQGRVICIIAPKSSGGPPPSEINPTKARSHNSTPRRTIVGTIARAPGANSNRYLFVPNSRTLPRFMAPAGSKPKNGESSGQLYKAEYIYGTWSATEKWAPCTNLKIMGQSCNIEDETMALLVEFDVDHGDFRPDVLKDVEKSVKSGRFQEEDSQELGWKPTPDMYKGRRDYREERIFTIDPTTAKDLDDALHIKELPDGQIEIGVHIADVSHFITEGSHVDEEAARRTTTVYLVDRVIPMLPRPLCEIACSLNENVERLAFSCVWTMNRDGTLAKKKSKGGKKSKENDVWYGRSVIRSCARLDYATAQNIIDRKVATGESVDEADVKYWPKSRQPTGGHTIDAVAADVRIMHTVAMARRKLRFENGALALNGIKLTFQMEDDGKTPLLCEPYPLRDSNRLIEEYMLLANYLVAQRLITHAGGLALLRQHVPPLNQGLQNVIEIAKEQGFEIDGTDSKSLQESLSRMGRECNDKLLMQCITELMMTPMCPAEYIASGEFEQEEWSHFALNIPYYTHFTSPIRRYPDVIVHRLLQATLDGQVAVDAYPKDQEEIQAACSHCNDKRMASKKAQERSDRIFLCVFLKKNPILSTLGVVVSIGDKAFTVFVPDLGVNGLVYLDDHVDLYDARVSKDKDSGKRTMLLLPKNGSSRSRLDIRVFEKLAISCHCNEKPPIDVKLRIAGPWTEKL